MIRGLAVLALALMASASPAQDSTGVAAPADTLAPRPDTLSRVLVPPSVPVAGWQITPVPVVTTALDLGDLWTGGWGPGRVDQTGSATPTGGLADRAMMSGAIRAGGFDYALGARGRTGGLALDGLAPDRLAASLDGRPLDDLFTGAPRTDVIPWEATDRLALQDATGGRPQTLAASLRPFRLAAPITELRYHTGGSGLQVISGTHAQTLGAPWGIGGDRARLTATAHVGSRQSDSPISGANLRHAHAIARLSLATPRWGAELTEHYTERTDGARRGVQANADLFDPLRALVFDAGAARRTLRNELSASLRAPLLSRQPATLWASWTRQVTRYSPSRDTLSVSGNRYALGVAGRLGGPTIRAWAALEDDPWGRLDPLADGNERLQFHAGLADTLTLGSARLAVQVGGHVAGGAFGPALAVRAEAGRLHGALSWAGVIPGRIEKAGFFPSASVGPGVIVGTASAGREQELSAEAGGAARLGTLGLAVKGFARIALDAQRLTVLQDVETAAATDVAFGFSRAVEPVGTVGLAGGIGWREGSASGVYLRSRLSASAWPFRGATALGDQMAEAAPALHGSARLGFRATRVGTGTAALDTGLMVRGWSAFRGVRLHPATGLLALERTASPRLPARAVLDLDARVTFGTRATVAVTWENVLSGLLYSGARVVQGEPLPGRLLRFGVFWAFVE